MPTIDTYGELSGYIALFNTPSAGYLPLHGDDDSRIEVVRPFAFSRALCAGHPPLVVNHDQKLTLAAPHDGNLRLWEDGYGLRFVCPLVGPLGEAVARAWMDGRVTGASFGFDSNTTRFDVSSRTHERVLVDVPHLADVSLTIDDPSGGTRRPAYPCTGPTIALRARLGDSRPSTAARSFAPHPASGRFAPKAGSGKWDPTPAVPPWKPASAPAGKTHPTAIASPPTRSTVSVGDLLRKADLLRVWRAEARLGVAQAATDRRRAKERRDLHHAKRRGLEVQADAVESRCKQNEAVLQAAIYQHNASVQRLGLPELIVT